MHFLIHFSSIVFLAGALAGSVGFQSLRKNRIFGDTSLNIGADVNELNSVGMTGIIGENPLDNLIDADRLEDDSVLNRLVAESKNKEATMTNPGRDTFQREMALTPILRMSVMCPSSVLLFSGRNDVRFILYNKNWPFGVDISKDLGAGKLLPKTPIKFLIHGFLNSGNSMMIQEIKDAYMEREEDYNVVAVDWTKGSGTWLSNYFDCLITSRVVPKVGEAVATFIVDLINTQNVNILYVNVIGHSLGAQISGRAGKKLIELNNKLPIIVGLDPALPGFQYNPESERLAPTDADYVEVIHSNPGDLGFETPLGTADFYPNWGLIKRNRQPSCITPACSHAMSFKLFAESIINPTAFEAYKCESFDVMKAGQCKYRGDRDVVYMGGSEMRNGKGAGVFKLETNRFAPFGKSQIN